MLGPPAPPSKMHDDAKGQRLTKSQTPILDPKTLTTEQKERLLDWLKHEDTLLAARLNLFLVSESLMTAAYATLPSASQAQAIVGLSGLIVTCTWWYVSFVQLRLTMRPLFELCQACFPEYELVATRRVVKGFPGPDKVLGLYSPVAFLAMWIGLLFVLCRV